MIDKLKLFFTLTPPFLIDLSYNSYKIILPCPLLYDRARLVRWFLTKSLKNYPPMIFGWVVPKDVLLGIHRTKKMRNIVRQCQIMFRTSNFSGIIGRCKVPLHPYFLVPVDGQCIHGRQLFRGSYLQASSLPAPKPFLRLLFHRY